MWRIDFGRNIRAGAHYLDFMVYDFDGDGQAEMMARTAEATKDGTGVIIGNANADYRTTAGYILTGPEYITVFNGKTGKAMATNNLYPPRGVVADWGDSYGNRVDRFKACVAYLDGQRPSAVFTRGYYAKWGAEAIDWRDGKLTQRWTFMVPNNSKDPNYSEGAHSLSVADVDGDGKQEVITGSLILDDNGTVYYNTNIGHGDALHVSDMDPDLPGLEISHIQEPVGDAGMYMYSGKTKNVLWRKATAAGSDEGPGRGVCADISAKYRGAESWAAGGGVAGVFDCKGNLTTLGNPQSCNFLAWWDGDILRELLNNTMIDKFEAGRLLTAYQIAPIASNNGTKSTPSLSGDIMGDWREEVIWRAAANDALYIFTTTTPSTYKFRTLMQDPQYRVAIAWQNTGYNQPPHLSYYLGDGMATPAKPNITVIPPANLVVTCTSTITSPATSFCTGGSVVLTSSTGSSYKWFNGTTQVGTAATYTAATAGNYTVEVTNAAGCKATSVVKAITVLALPTATITSPATSFCTGASVVLTSSTGSSYKWFNGTTQVGTAATYSATTAGAYTVEVTNSSGCKATSTVTQLSVTALPTATITSPGTSFCPGGSVVLTASTGSSYKWFNGTTQVGTAATYTATAAGSYTLEVTNSNGCKATSTPTVLSVSSPVATIAASAREFCTGSSVLLTASAGSSYKWFSGAAQVGTSATYTVTADGNYTLEVTNSSGCKATSAVMQITASTPAATISSTSTVFCAGSSVALTANTGASYKWFNGTTQIGTEMSYNANTPGSYTVEITNSSGCKALSDAKQITIAQPSVWYADLDNDGKGDPATSLTTCWQPNGYVSVAGDDCPASADNNCLDCAGIANGTAVLDNCSICTGGTTGKIACTPTATINGTNSNIKVIPQPFDVNTTITIENYGTIQSITIISASGALVESLNGLNTTEINIGESLAAGLYSVIIQTEKGLYTTKIVKR